MQRASKLRNIEDLPGVLNPLRAGDAPQRIVHCHGVFDLLHIGHIRHFEKAKKFGDVLVVTVTPDRFVNKGPHRPAFSEDLRAESIAALDCVDYVAINRWPTAVETIKLIKPDRYVKGADYKEAQNDATGGITEEEATVRSVGGEILFTDDIVFSSSNLINKHLPVFPPEVSNYLEAFSQRHPTDEVLEILERARSLKTLVVGEAIIDEYQYCEQMGKSAKEPILAVSYISTDKFAGGSLAVANHVAGFCDDVTLLTCLGTEDSHEDMIRRTLMSNVEAKFLYKESSPTIVKRRFVESYLSQKLFEVYVMSNSGVSEAEESSLCGTLQQILNGYDLVIVTDYGHGMLTDPVIETLCSKAKFLAVNTQANAGNRGFNTVSRYPSADYVSLTREELGLAESNRPGPVADMVLNVSRDLSCSQFLVTMGKEGNIAYRESQGFIESPALASQVIDTMGAGDAVLSVTSLCAGQQAPLDILGFIGNAVGAQAVGTLGHRASINRLELSRHIDSLLK